MCQSKVPFYFISLLSPWNQHHLSDSPHERLACRFDNLSQVVLIWIHPKHVSLRNKLLNCYLNNRGLGCFTPSSSACDSLTIFFTLRVGKWEEELSLVGVLKATLTYLRPNPSGHCLLISLPLGKWMGGYGSITITSHLKCRYRGTEAEVRPRFGWLLLSPNADPYQLRFNNSKIKFWFIPGTAKRTFDPVCVPVCHQQNKCWDRRVQSLSDDSQLLCVSFGDSQIIKKIPWNNRGWNVSEWLVEDRRMERRGAEVKLWCFETVSSSMVIIKQFPKSSHTTRVYMG